MRSIITTFCILSLAFLSLFFFAPSYSSEASADSSPVIGTSEPPLVAVIPTDTPVNIETDQELRGSHHIDLPDMRISALPTEDEHRAEQFAKVLSGAGAARRRPAPKAKKGSESFSPTWVSESTLNYGADLDGHRVRSTAPVQPRDTVGVSLQESQGERETYESSEEVRTVEPSANLRGLSIDDPYFD